ncbi:MAG: carboxylating nicotinate-nucleotide diphosphorylase, partial [Elusimicrobiota bacterium]
MNNIIENALKEDNSGKDITARLFIPSKAMVRAVILAKSPGIVCGLDIVRQVYRLIDARCRLRIKTRDGNKVRKGQIVAELYGPARSLLSGERTALNFLQHLSGIATLTGRFVQKTKGTRAGIYDTRKTIPGLRQLDKYAVRCGGGRNHRMNLGEMALIKDNHLKLLINGPEAVRKAKKRHPELMIEVECENLSHVRKFAGSGADYIMLDNMGIKTLRKAVTYIRKRDKNVQIEISGGVTLKNASKLALLGVERISVGALTHSAPALDFSME